MLHGDLSMPLAFLAYLITVLYYYNRQRIYHIVSRRVAVSEGDGLRVSAAATACVTLRSYAHFRLRQLGYSACQSNGRAGHGGLTCMICMHRYS